MNGECRRYPPRIMGTEERFVSLWPRVFIGHWCGEHRGEHE